MSNNNNFLQGMGMQMPMFTSANQQAGNDDIIDLHDIFADFFAETNVAAFGDQQTQQAQFAHAQATLDQQQLTALPTGQGIKTAWHTGSLPAISNQQTGVDQVFEEPQSKRLRTGGEDFFLPYGQQQIQPQQQMLPVGAGGLSSRLGFTLPNNSNNTNNLVEAATNLIGQQQQQSIQQMTGGFDLPIGMGVKFGAGGAVITQQQQQQQQVNNGALNVTNATAAALLAANQAGFLLSNTTTSNNQQPSMGIPNALMNQHSVEEQMAEERRLRNREHAKRSRVRKKFMLESLQHEVRGLQEENSTLRLLVQTHIPQDALKIIDECCSKSVLFGVGENNDGTPSTLPQQTDKKKKGNNNSVKETSLLQTDFSLITSLTSGQQNFVLSDPRLPDNPIVFASQGFYDLTGYTRDQVLGRNCRFLQGAGTDRKAIDVIRTAVANGTDATVCLLNYKADGTPFWNQLFVAALRDADNCIVNYVGVQTMIEPNAGATALEEKVDAAHPITVGREEGDTAKKK